MDTEKGMQGHSAGCCVHGGNECGGMCMGMPGRHWAHVVMRIAVALIIFWLGVQFGELKAVLHSSYAPYGMMGRYSEAEPVYYANTGYGMMGSRTVIVSPTASTTR